MTFTLRANLAQLFGPDWTVECLQALATTETYRATRHHDQRFLTLIFTTDQIIVQGLAGGPRTYPLDIPMTNLLADVRTALTDDEAMTRGFLEIVLDNCFVV